MSAAADWRRHKQVCGKCSTGSAALQSLCAEGLTLQHVLAEQQEQSRQQCERAGLAAMGQGSLFDE